MWQKYGKWQKLFVCTTKSHIKSKNWNSFVFWIWRHVIHAFGVDEIAPSSLIRTMASIMAWISLWRLQSKADPWLTNKSFGEYELPENRLHRQTWRHVNSSMASALPWRQLRHGVKLLLEFIQRNRRSTCYGVRLNAAPSADLSLVSKKFLGLAFRN